MSEQAGPTQPTGPWDVVLYIVQRFPIFAAIIIVIALAGYGLKFLVEAQQQAESELHEARVRITEMERNARKLIEDASLIKLEALRIEKEAAINAATEVEEAMIDTSRQVQSLVSSQIESMKSIDDLRKQNLASLELRIKELNEQRVTAQQELEAEREQQRYGRIRFWIEDLAQSSKNNNHDLVKRALEIPDYEDEDPSEVSKIVLEAAENASTDLRISLLLGLYERTKDDISFASFAAAFGESANPPSVDWIRSYFGCCHKLTNEHHSLLVDATVALANSTSDPFRLLALAKFGDLHEDTVNWYLQDVGMAAEDRRTWIIYSKAFQAWKNKNLTFWDRTWAIDDFSRIHPRAAFVFEKLLRDEPLPPDETFEDLDRQMARLRQRHPDLSGAVTNTEIDFWSQVDVEKLANGIKEMIENN